MTTTHKILQSLRIPARFMRGGTSKGVFFTQSDLPPPGRRRDQILLRTMGSPDPYGKQIDGMGGATSSTSKIVVVGPSKQPGHDIEYLFGQASVKEKFMDYSGNCGNLTAAVGPYAISQGMVENVPENGVCEVKMWQQNIAKTIVARVLIVNGEPQELGELELDGVTFPAAKIGLEFLAPSDSNVFPTGNLVDSLEFDGHKYEVTLINAAIPMVFLKASDFGLKGTEIQDQIDNDSELLEKLGTLRAIGACKMGLIKSVEEGRFRQHSPKLALVAPPQDYVSASGKNVAQDSINLTVRAISMGKMHHAFMGTGAVALAAAASIPGTIVSQLKVGNDGVLRFGHPSGILEVGVEVAHQNGEWTVSKAIMNRSARTLMEGSVHVPVV